MATILMDSSKVRAFEVHRGLHSASRTLWCIATILIDSSKVRWLDSRPCTNPDKGGSRRFARSANRTACVCRCTCHADTGGQQLRQQLAGSARPSPSVTEC